jgi:hypothetical protein
LDEPSTVQGISGLLALLAGVFAKGGWDWLKARRVASSEVQAAQIVDDTHIRSELWDALAKLQERTDRRIDAMQEALDTSRREHISLLGEYALLKAEHITLKNEHDALKIRYAALEIRITGA